MGEQEARELISKLTLEEKKALRAMLLALRETRSIKSRRQISGEVVEIKINCGNEGIEVFKAMQNQLINTNRRLKTNGGLGISYDIQLRDSQSG